MSQEGYLKKSGDQSDIECTHNSGIISAHHIDSLSQKETCPASGEPHGYRPVTSQTGCAREEIGGERERARDTQLFMVSWASLMSMCDLAARVFEAPVCFETTTHDT